MKRKPYIQVPIVVEKIDDHYEATLNCGCYARGIDKLVGIGDTPEWAINASRVAHRCLRRRRSGR